MLVREFPDREMKIDVISELSGIFKYNLKQNVF